MAEKLKYDVASVLERETQHTITRWYARVEDEADLVKTPLTREERCAHLPEMFRDLVFRLRNPLPLGSRALTSSAAHNHGCLRRDQGYTAAMMVEESRMLQVSIFHTLQTNLSTVDFSLLLVDVMTIADEVDSQLKQTIVSFSEAAADVAA